MEEEEPKNRAFSELKGYCVDLLNILQSPAKSHSAAKLSQLLHFLQSCPPNVLQPFLDYTLFPLLLLLDASLSCRSPESVNSNEMSAIFNGQTKPGNVSESVSEGALQCLEELLKKCHLGSLDQMVVLLKKLTYGATLSPSQASEEFRGGVIKCFRALLLNLHPCLLDSCACKQVLGFPALLDKDDMEPSLTKHSKYYKQPKDCLIAFFQSEIASAAIGHSLSLLLKAAETEASRGHRGSAKLRIEAFLTFRMLVAKVGTADALAFFLPGVVSQLARVLHASRTLTSGAAGSSEVTNLAVRSLGEFLMIVLEDDANISELDLSLIDGTGFHPNEDFSSHLILEELQRLPINADGPNKVGVENSNDEILESAIVEAGFKEKKRFDSGDIVGSLRVSRTKDWLKKTSVHIDKLLSATFPHICVHPAKKVRYGLLTSIQGLFTKCNHTLGESRLMLLECLFVLACDDSEEVSVDAQKFLEHLFASTAKPQLECDVVELFTRLIGKLPKVMLGSEESLVLCHAQQLLAVMYYSGPQLVVDHLLRSSVTTARFMDVFAHCLSHNFVFSGSLEKLVITKPLSTGYLQSFSELKNSLHLIRHDHAVLNSKLAEASKSHDRDNPVGMKAYELPQMPPWFVRVGSQKLYQALAAILRLVGLSIMSDSRSEASLSPIIDIPLNYFRTLVAEIRMREYRNDGWQSWYSRIGSGQLLRQASTSACILNELIFGMSDQAADALSRMFKSRNEKEDIQDCDSVCSHKFAWRLYQEDARIQLIDCVGSILHEYLSPEIWDLPREQGSTIEHPSGQKENLTLHFLQDTAMLHQVIIDGIGIFNMCLGKDFDSSGFLHSSLYLLLENLSCRNFQIRSAADNALQYLSATSGYPTVGHLVVTNSDYIIDSICQQLRHLNVNHHAPNLLGAMLSYIGVAHKVLPLLEEPMRCVSLELEILGRHQHPDMTIPFLKAVAEIAKAAKREASSILSEAESYCDHVKLKFSGSENKAESASYKSSLHCDDHIDSAHTKSGADSVDFEVHAKQVECMLLKFKDCRECRQTVGSIIGSCLAAATPLLASVNQLGCLVALNIVEDGVATLAQVEAAYKQEKAAKETLVETIRSGSFRDLQDMLDVSEDHADENRLLPAMNKLWPFLVVCVQGTNTAVLCRCLSVVSTVVQICGGDFFSRRFFTDGPHFWKILSTSPFHKNPKSKQEKGRLLLPYRRHAAQGSDDGVAESSNLKVQVGMLEMIANISRNKRSAPAFRAVLKKICGLVVGIACSGVGGLRDAAVNALSELASIDPDLVWLLMADVYYSFKREDGMPSPPGSGFPEMSRVLPPPVGRDRYLYVQYGGQSFGFNVDESSVEIVFKGLHSRVFTFQMYS